MSQHTWLVVDDDAGMLSVACDVCAAMDWKTVTAMNLAEVKARIEEGGFCGVLLDLQIPAEPHGRPLVGSGEAALRLLRKYDKRPAREHHVLPIVILSGYSDAPDFSFGFGRLGADDYISKTFEGDFSKRLEHLSARLVLALQRAGRADHAECAALQPGAAPEVILRVGGEKIGRRYQVHVDGKPRQLAPAWFVVLVRLALAHRKQPGVVCTYQELAIENPRHASSRLRGEVALDDGGDVVEIVYGQGVRLLPHVKIEMDDAVLAKHADDDVRRLFARGRRVPPPTPPAAPRRR